MGIWDFEHPEVPRDTYDATGAMPGTKEKLSVMAERVQAGLPLWHPHDRHDLDDPPPVRRKPR